MNKLTYHLEDEYIRLDDLLKLNGCVDTGGQAKMLIQGGGVTLNGEVCTMRGKKLVDGDTVRVAGQDTAYTVAVQ